MKQGDIRRVIASAIGTVFAASASVLPAESPAPLPALNPLLQHVMSHLDGAAPNSIDFAALKGDRSELPIGVFDSGIGGLTVLEAMLKLDSFNNKTLHPGADGIPDFAGEKFIYLGDQANMPYGNYPFQGREEYLRELIVKDMVFLLGRRYYGAEGPRFDKRAVKAVVIACNTATAYGIDDMRAALKTWDLDVPVIGVVEAGARAVVEHLPADGPPPTVGVLATVGTCSSQAYPKAIQRFAGMAGKPVHSIHQWGSRGLAGAIEGNPGFVWNGPGERPVPYAGPEHVALNSVADYIAYDVKCLTEGVKLPMDTIVRHRFVEQTTSGPREMNPGRGLGILVMGCTHFPLIEEQLSAALQKQRAAFMSDKDALPKVEAIESKVIMINPAELTAKELFRELARQRLRSKGAAVDKAAPLSSFFLSVPNPASQGVKLAPDGSLDPAYKMGRKTGEPSVEDTKVVPMTMETLPGSSRVLVEKLPAVAGQIKAAR